MPMSILLDFFDSYHVLFSYKFWPDYYSLLHSPRLSVKVCVMYLFETRENIMVGQQN